MLHLTWIGCCLLAAADPQSIEKGAVHFRPTGEVATIPERYRLDEHTFDYQLAPKGDLPASGTRLFHLTYPSPVTTPYPENNTVHAEYYRPAGDGPFPAVIVLDILGGDQVVSRTIAAHLAHNGIAGLFVQMAYYGPRRPPNSNVRLLTTNYQHTMDAVRQTVLDIRRAAAWLEGRSEIDGKRLGILGTSLGSFMGSLSAEMEPKLRRVAILLGGGGLVDAYYDDPRAAGPRKIWEALGGTKQKLADLIAPADPLTCAANLRDRQVLILAAKRDEIVPPRATEALWKATGMQKIVWFDCTHYGAVLFLAPALDHIVRHFGAL